jgi:kynurenine formamidase
MAEIIDLTIPIKEGEGRLETKVIFERPYTFEKHGWQGSNFRMFAHYPTHIDAPSHHFQDGQTIDEVPLNRLMGAAALIDLSDHGRNAGITDDTLEERGHHTRPGDICILYTGWSDNWGTDKFWLEGPFLEPSGADWLVEREVAAIVYDFAEEYVVRKPDILGKDCIIHHKILGNNIYNIEYVQNLNKISNPRLTIIALPLKLVGLDGSPARVIAIENMDLPGEFSIK